MIFGKGVAVDAYWATAIQDMDRHRKLAAVITPADPGVTRQEAIRRATNLLLNATQHPTDPTAVAALATAWLKLAPHLPHEPQDER